MIVRTVELLNHLRCRRYSALHPGIDALPEQDDYSLGITEEVDDLQSDEERIEFLDDYRESGETLRSLFAKLTFESLSSVKQNIIYQTPFNHDFILQAKMDFVSDTDQETTFYKISMCSASHFLKLKYSFSKHKYNLFEKNAEGTYSPRIQRVVEGDRTNYFDKLKRCLSRHYDTGRLVYDLGFAEFVISKRHHESQRRYLLVMLNPDFILKTDEQGNPIYESGMFVRFDFTDLVISLQSKIQADLYRMANLIELNDDSRCNLVKDECLKDHPFECEYTSYCFSHIPQENSILNYFSSHQGFREGIHKNDLSHDAYDLINEGIVDMQDLPISWLQREKNLMQRYCVDNDYTYINKKKMKEYLKQLSYPLHFLDFESYPSPIPRFAGESVFSQSVFQYSLHIQPHKTSKDLSHYDFLATDHQDHRVELVESLLERIPIGKSSIVVYNVTFEQQRLQEFQKLFPKYATHLQNLESRLFDLLKLLKTDLHYFLDHGYPEEESKTYHFYHPKQSGSYSIKKILKVLGRDDYESLRVKNGVMAYKQYLMLPTLSESDRIKAIQALKDYCAQDTMSMVYILEEMKKHL